MLTTVRHGPAAAATTTGPPPPPAGARPRRLASSISRSFIRSIRSCIPTGYLLGTAGPGGDPAGPGPAALFACSALPTSLRSPTVGAAGGGGQRQRTKSFHGPLSKPLLGRGLRCVFEKGGVWERAESAERDREKVRRCKRER